VTGSREEKARPTSLDQIIESVCEKYGVTEQELDSASRKRTLTRVGAEIGFIARETGVATITEVARRFGRSQAGLSRAITNCAKTIKLSY
jgi:chromosomal replication initiation ATPase DnaA